MALYDDEVLFVVPGSHARLNTAEENAQLAEGDSVPLPNSVQTKLNAGDAAVCEFSERLFCSPRWKGSKGFCLALTPVLGRHPADPALGFELQQ